MANLIILVHNIRSTHNVGSILRTAEGFGVSKAIFSGYTPFPAFENENFAQTGRLPHIAQKINSQIAKTALGAEKIVPFEISSDIFETISKLKNDGFKIIALEQSEKSIPLQDFHTKNDEKIALLLGEEVHGITPELLEKCEKTLEIPMFGKKESFNVSVATGIALFQIQAKSQE